MFLGKRKTENDFVSARKKRVVCNYSADTFLSEKTHHVYIWVFSRWCSTL